MKNVKYCFILVLMISVLPLYAQNKASVSGVVISNEKKSASNIAVSIEGTHYGSTTNEKGEYQFTCPPGTYTLVATALDYKTLKTVITVKSGKNVYNLTIENKDNELEEVVVVGGRNKFANKESDYIAKLPLKNLENPQVYSVIGKELIKEQMIVNFDDVLKNSSGIDKLWSSTGRGGDGAAYFTLRGFSTQANMINGLGGQTNGSLDPANIERVEVLKGPSGTLFGSSLVSFGGLINVVTKQPYEKFGGDFSYTMGGNGLMRVAADINAPVNKEKTLLLRTNAAYQNENSFQDAGFSRSYFFAPSLLYKASDRLTFTLNTEFYTMEGTNPLMVFLNRSRDLEYRTPDELGMDYKKSFTSNDITIKTPTVRLFGSMEYKINDQWKSQTSVSQSIRQSKGLYSYVMFQGAVKDDSLNRWVGSQNATGTTMDIQQNFIGDFKIGNLRNRLVVGLDYFHTKSNDASSYILFDKVASQGTDPSYAKINAASVEAALGGNTPSKSISKSNIYSAYFSDVLNLTDQLLVMASLRLDHFSNEGTLNVNKGTTSGDYNQTALSPKFGAVYQILPDKLSVFANYMNGFKNVGSSTQPDGSVRTFKPQQANQIEGGFKLSLFDNKLVGSISYYDIYVTNITRPDPEEQGYTIQDGDVYSRGFEVDITANPVNGLNIIAGYSYNDSENKKTDAGSLGRRPVGAGPKTLVNGWISYTVPQGAVKGLGFGFGGNYAGENKITNSAATGVFTLPAYTVLNATAFYNTGAWNFGLKVNNLTDKKYWKGWTTVEPQKTRQVIGSISFHF